jgi:RNA polymerase sigma-70 factor (sigma-E family)
VDVAAQASFREFVAARQGALLRSAYVLCGDRHRAEDLVQGALTRTAARWAHVRDGDPEAYVRRAMYHEQISRWRRTTRIRETSVPTLPERPVPDRNDTVDLRLALRSALDQLTPKQRAVLVLRFYEDRPEREVAELLGVSVGTVRSTSARALDRLRKVAPELLALDGLDGREATR